ncbi:MAG: transcription antitermination factor NusB [Spirochaetaceae bacterium]|nr:transcription antitermination factor NusB [Spirochaetaceae bacterium]
MSRRKGRILAFQALYSWDVGETSEDELLSFSWADGSEEQIAQNGGDADFARLLVRGTLDKISEIDALIASHLSPSWTMERLNKVTLAVLRMSVYSLLYQNDLHPTIIIDEAIAIVKDYGQYESFKFINAILDKISKDVSNTRNNSDN